MSRFNKIASFLLLSFLSAEAFAQREDAPLRIFGYFQNSLQHWTTFEQHAAQNSFGLQQLNIFFQKDLSRNWTAFVNFEALNSFSSSRRWGSLNLEEAWVKYNPTMKFNLKLGLQIPIFNNLNEIKNRTPLLPYIVRPLVYETSFGEFIPLEEFVPARAFVQAYGFFPVGETKFDYAAYLGNSHNISNDPTAGQTGVDTSDTFLVGGRVGLRRGELKLGVSATYERLNDFIELAPLFNRPRSELQELPMTRFGGDLSYNFSNFSFESEYIAVKVRPGFPELELALDFFYATLGYHFSNALYGYGSYWLTKARNAGLIPNNEVKTDENIPVFSLGVSYDLSERIRIKGQVARVRSAEERLAQGLFTKTWDNFNVWAIAVSVFF